MGTNSPSFEIKRAASAPSSGTARHYYVYMLECRGGRLYTGVTTNVGRRLAEHRSGKRGAKFTRAYPPVELRAVRRVTDRSAALILEAALKKLTHKEKLDWAAQHKPRPAGMR